MARLLLLFCITGAVSANDQNADSTAILRSVVRSDTPPQVPKPENKDVSNDPNEQDRCLTDFKERTEQYQGRLQCQKNSEGKYTLACVGKYRRFASYQEGELEIEVCELKNCQEYCNEEEGKECHEDECVCKRSHFASDKGICVPYCTKKNPCQNGGICKLDESAPFHCWCKPGFKGPICEFEDVLMATTIRNTVIVGVVFGILIVLCLFVAIVIVQRLKNKIAMKESASEAYENIGADL